MNFKLGADPEVFLSDGLNYVSAFGLFPGTKKEPFKVEKGAVQVDGMALEFNIDPAGTEDEFSDNIEIVRAQMMEMVRKVDPSLQLVFEPYAEFERQYFAAQPLDAKILGCDPDYDYKGRMKTPPDGLQDSNFRTTAGHLHIGFTEGKNPTEAGHFEDCRFLSQKFFDLGLFSPVTEKERKRIKYYGGSGSFRPKSYGVELRSPSNLWVASRETQKEVFRKVKKVMHSL